MSLSTQLTDPEPMTEPFIANKETATDLFLKAEGQVGFRAKRKRCTREQINVPQ